MRVSVFRDEWIQMNEGNPEKMSDSDSDRDSTARGELPKGMSPYATGGGGVTFERRVAVKFLTHLLVGNTTSGIGDDRRVVSVAFQQAPDCSVDDLVVSAARPDEMQPSLVLALAVRRKPKIVKSDKSTCKLFLAFVRDMINAPTNGPEHRFGLVVAGSQQHAEQLSTLAEHAATQMDAPGFFHLIHTADRFKRAIRGRLYHFEKLVEYSLTELGTVEISTVSVQQYTWQLLSHLTVSMPRLETPDETDWSVVTNSLKPVSQGSNLTAALNLRNRLVELASDYSVKAARVDLRILRRDTHVFIESTVRRNEQGWQTLDLLNGQALRAVRGKIISYDNSRCICLNRSDQAMELSKKVTEAQAVVVSGESGIGKSALVVRGLTAAAEEKPDEMQVLCINLRHVPELPIKLEANIDIQLSRLLDELSAPQRVLIIDGADAIVEGRNDAFRYLIESARESDIKVVAVTSTSIDSGQAVQEILKERFGNHVTEHVVVPLTDTEIDEIVRTFTELQGLNSNPKSRELLRRLVVVDLLVRSDVRGVPLSDADAMHKVWSGLVRRPKISNRGTSDMRESVLLQLANQALRGVSGDERFNTVNELNSTALDGLRSDGLLRTSDDNPFMIGPEFAHDEVRRYAVARLLLADRAPAEKIKVTGAPRWSLSATRLACQALLAEPDMSNHRLRGRFARLQASFDALVEEGHSARWADMPGEALITLANPRPILQDAWPDLKSNNAAGLKRLTRLVGQRLRNINGIINTVAIEPIIELLLEDRVPWKSGEYAQELLRDWLHGHVVANTSAGDLLRIRLREHLVCACTTADRRLTKEQEDRAAKLAARTPEEVERDNRIEESLPKFISAFGQGGGDQRPEVPYEITEDIFLELLALLGPDLGIEGEAILCRVAQDAPSRLAPAVEELFTGRALASYGRGLLAQLTEAYYLDDEPAWYESHGDGIRGHNSRSVGLYVDFAWYNGPFYELLRGNFRSGVAVLNRLLNHATRIRVRKLARLHRSAQAHGGNDVALYQTALELTGKRRLYLGDEHIWRWYRGSGVGPDPCISALQALERVCDQLIKNDIPIKSVISILLYDCKSLAMVGLVVGLLIRHLEKAERLLDAYLTEPLIWDHEIKRVVAEVRGFAASSDGVVARERRSWSLREVVADMVMGANGQRVRELQELGQQLIENAHRQFGPTTDHERVGAETDATGALHRKLAGVRAWVSYFDRSAYNFRATSDGLVEISIASPEDVLEALQDSDEDLKRGQKLLNLRSRYFINLGRASSESVENDELESDLSIARQLLKNPPSMGFRYSWDVSALVVAAALKAHLLYGANLSEEVILFAVDTVLRVGEGEAGMSSLENEISYYEDGADRSAARAIPLLLLPAAASLRAAVDNPEGLLIKHRSGITRVGRVLRAIIGKRSELTASERVIRSGFKLARTASYEVRLHLACGLDYVWKTPCTEKGHCHHDVGWHLVKETMRDCVLGDFDVKSHRRPVIKLRKPVAKSLGKFNGESIAVLRLDAAIRALAPAAMANICVSDRAQLLLSALLDAQRRALLFHRNSTADERGSHTLVSARALLTLAEHRDNIALFAHIDAYADRPTLLGALLRALSAAAEETQNRAATARRIWPAVVRHVLALEDAGHVPFQDDFYGDRTLASLLPNSAHEIQYLYREIQDKPIAWWDPISLRSEVEEWLKSAVGQPRCVSQLIFFIRVLAPEDQVQTGLPWVAKLVLVDSCRDACRTEPLSTWLIETRSAADDVKLLNLWQKVVDALVVAGVMKLASYSQ